MHLLDLSAFFFSVQIPSANLETSADANDNPKTGISGGLSSDVSGGLSGGVSGGLSGGVSGGLSGGVSGGLASDATGGAALDTSASADVSGSDAADRSFNTDLGGKTFEVSADALYYFIIEVLLTKSLPRLYVLKFYFENLCFFAFFQIKMF